MCIVIGANLVLYRLIRKRATTPDTCKPSQQNTEHGYEIIFLTIFLMNRKNFPFPSAYVILR